MIKFLDKIGLFSILNPILFTANGISLKAIIKHSFHVGNLTYWMIFSLGIIFYEYIHHDFSFVFLFYGIYFGICILLFLDNFIVTYKLFDAVVADNVYRKFKNNQDNIDVNIIHKDFLETLERIEKGTNERTPPWIYQLYNLTMLSFIVAFLFCLSKT